MRHLVTHFWGYIAMIIGMLCILVLMVTEPEQVQVAPETLSYMAAYDSLREVGWQPYAAHVIAAFEVGVYDVDSNPKEWAEYQAYMED